jgi:hypothetical protein
MRFKFLVAAGVLALSTGVAQASPISVTSFSVGDYNAKLGTFGERVVENFESFTEGNVGNGPQPNAGFVTSVGTFWTMGGTGSGGTVKDPVSKGNFAGNDGTKLAIRDGNVFGRTSTTALLTGVKSDDKFLDSNDTLGIEWLVQTGGMFNRLMFTLTDAADTGATMTISAGGSSTSFSTKGNGNRQTVYVDFGGVFDTATITLFNTNPNGTPRLNDGFSIDDIAISAVPLPAPALMLLAGLAGLAAMRRKRAAA